MKLVILDWGTLDEEDANMRQFLSNCKCRGLKSVVASSAPEENVNLGIDAKNLRLLISRTFGRLNNGGGNLRMIVSQSNVGIKDTLYVSDNPAELQLAKSIGLITVGFRSNGKKSSEVKSAQPHFYARSFHDVNQIVENLLREIPSSTE